MERRVAALAVALAFLGCKTPNKYTPTDAEVGEGVVDGSPPTPDLATAKSDMAVAPDMAIAADVSAPPPDTAAAAPDVLPADTAPSPCSNGTARCAPSGTAVELCTNGVWTLKETCPLTCSGATCTAVCMAGVSCTMGIAPCRKGATFCATPTSQPLCNEAGVDDARGGCSGGNVCKNGDCVAACKSGVACSEGIGACRKGQTTCASPTSQATCKDIGADDSKGGCTGGQICGGGKCVEDPCVNPSTNNLVPNAGFDTSIWSRAGGGSVPIGSWNSSDAMGCSSSGSLEVPGGADARVCISFGSASTLYFGYMVKRSTTTEQSGCGVDTWYFDGSCTDAFDYGTEFVFSRNVTGWQTLSDMFFPPAMTKSFLLTCHHQKASAGPALFDRIYVRTTPGGF